MMRIGRMLAWGAALWLLCSGPTVLAQPSAAQPSASSPVSEFGAIKSDVARVVARGSGSMALPPQLLEEDQKGFVAHRQWQRQFARESWEWHLFSTRLLMFVVLVIVGCGLWFTYIQFTRDAGHAGSGRRNDATGDPEDGAPGAPKPTTVKIGPGGLEVTSQVIGLLVLGFSLAFFYLYVKEVYPIQEAQLRSQAEAAAAPAASQANPSSPPAR